MALGVWAPCTFTPARVVADVASVTRRCRRRRRLAARTCSSCRRSRRWTRSWSCTSRLWRRRHTARTTSVARPCSPFMHLAAPPRLTLMPATRSRVDGQGQGSVRARGSTLAFSGPVQTPMLCAAVASAKLHLTPDFATLQDDPIEKIRFASARASWPIRAHSRRRGPLSSYFPYEAPAEHLFR
jgi:hypothetical protein